MTTVNMSRVSMIRTTRKITKGLSRLALMGSVALPSSFAMGLGIVAAPVMFAPSAEAAVIIGNRNKIKERPRRNYRSTVRIDRDLFDANVEVSVKGQVKFFAPDGTSGPVIDLNLTPAKTSVITNTNPIFVRTADAANNIIAASVEGGTCGGTEVNIEVPFESKSPVTFTLCDNGENTVEGKAWFTNAGKLRATFAVPFDKAARSDLYGRILIKGQPLEMERTVYTGNVNEVEPGALTGFTYEQTINVVDVFGKILDSQTVRGIVGEDDVEVMGPAHVIIGNRNRIRKKPRRNYKSVGVSQDNSGGDAGTGTATVTVTANFEIIYTAADGQNTAPPIPPITLTEPARANIALTYGDGPNAGDTLFGGYCGGSFAVPVGGVDDENDIIIDDMGGTSIEGTELAIRANTRLDGSLRVRIKGDYSAIKNCEADSLFAENTGPLSDSFVNYIWEGDIDVDPRSFDGDQYERITTLTDENGKLLDSFTDLVVLDAPETTATQRASCCYIRFKRVKIKKRRTGFYQGRAVSTGPAQGEDRNTELHFVLGNVYDGIFREVGGDIKSTQIAKSPATSIYRYQVPATEDGTLKPDAWCGLEFKEPLTLNQDSVLSETVTATLSEANNGNYKVTVKQSENTLGDDDGSVCGETDHFRVNGIDAYDLGVTNTWATEFPDLAPDTLGDQNFFLETRLVDSETSEILIRNIQGLSANDVPVEGPQISYVDSGDFDWETQEWTGYRAVARGLPQGKPFDLTYNLRDEAGNVVNQPSEVTTCHLYNNTNVTFADPDSVIDQQYLVEITTSDAEGQEIAYQEHLVVGSDGSPNNFGEQIGEAPFKSSVVLYQNDDQETYELALSLCGQPQTVNEVAIFMTPQDGGSDADPEDFTLEFVDKVGIIENRDPQTVFVTGQTAFFETRLSVEGGQSVENSDVWAATVSNDKENCEGSGYKSELADGVLTVNVCHLRETAPYGDDGIQDISQQIGLTALPSN